MPSPIRAEESAARLSGSGTGAAAIVRLVSAKKPPPVVPPLGSPKAIVEIGELLVTPKKSAEVDVTFKGTSSVELSPKVMNAS